MCCLVPAGLGPLPLQPSPPGSPRETGSTGSCLSTLALPGPFPAWERPLILTKAARWQLGLPSTCLVAAATCLGLQPLFPQAPRVASADKRRRLCPRFSLSEPTPPGLTSQGTCFFQWAMLASKAHSRNQKRNRRPVRLCVPKTGHAGSASSGPSCCLILIYCFFFFLRIQMKSCTGWPRPKDSEGLSPSSPWLCHGRAMSPLSVDSLALASQEPG